MRQNPGQLHNHLLDVLRRHHTGGDHSPEALVRTVVAHTELDEATIWRSRRSIQASVGVRKRRHIRRLVASKAPKLEPLMDAIHEAGPHFRGLSHSAIEVEVQRQSERWIARFVDSKSGAERNSAAFVVSIWKYSMLYWYGLGDYATREEEDPGSSGDTPAAPGLDKWEIAEADAEGALTGLASGGAAGLFGAGVATAPAGEAGGAGPAVGAVVGAIVGLVVGVAASSFLEAKEQDAVRDALSDDKQEL